MCVGFIVRQVVQRWGFGVCVLRCHSEASSTEMGVWSVSVRVS